MKAKLIKLELNEGYRLDDEKGNLIASTLDGAKTKLSKQNCDEIFGVIDVEKLAMGYELYEKINFVGQTRAYIAGFNKAMELNKDKVFTLEDMKRAIDKAKQGSVKETHNGYGRPTEPRFVLDDLSYDEIIQSLQQPTEIEVEIEIKKVVDETKVIGAVKGVKGSGDKITTYKSVPKLDENGCLILKKI
jgi:hypothetical protein